MKPDDKPDRMFQVIAVWDVLAHDATEARDIIQWEARQSATGAWLPDRWEVTELEKKGDDEHEVQGH